MLPEEMQQELIRKRAADFAQLTPSQQLAQAQYSMSANAGQGLAKAFGVDIEEPRMKLQSKLTQLSQGIPQTAEGLTEYSRRLSADKSIPAIYASQAMDKAREIAKTEAETGLKGAQADKARNYQMANTASERNRKLISELEVKLAEDPTYKLSPKEEAELRWQIGQETKPRTTFDAESGKAITVEPINLEQAAPNINKYLSSKAAPGAPASKVSTSQVTEPKLGESVVKEVATTDQDIQNAVTTQRKLTTLTPSIDKLNLGAVANYERAGLAWLGTNTPDALAFKELQRAVRAQSNAMLNLAKGVQTKDDAERIDALFADESTWKNKDSLKAAFADMVKTTKDTEAALRIKRETLTSKGRAPAPTNNNQNVIAPKPSPMSGKNPDIQPETPQRATHRFNPATGRIEVL